ncbi:unnamed protein product [Xylocopa violacea]|uniref:Uncharacterized protein n=1 Tax=Xylocopa violacea TaxID=135666 RepID=A0ABP1P3M2_XYLVO
MTMNRGARETETRRYGSTSLLPLPHRQNLAACHEPDTAFLGPLFKFPSARSQYSLGSSLLNGWKRAGLSRTPDAGQLVRARNFSTASFASKGPARIVGLSNELARYLPRKNQTRSFWSNPILMARKKPPSPPATSESCSKFAPDCGTRPTARRGPCRATYQRQKPCPPPEKCIPPAPPCCRKRPLNPKCADQPQAPCPPPCPMPCPEPVKIPPPKICYRKCPPPPKLPRLPKCPKIPAPPPPPPPPKVPRPPRCPPPCPPPPAPPLPKCPRAPKCPECPPQKECPPPPPCEPCPCPPPCPPPCCPPPPPCPPCAPPIPCPKPLPCPPTPCRVCPPCPPCPECPKPPPCPPPPPCCPCPCPKPPPPCPCPKPCPPCKTTEASCPEDAPSCPKNSKPVRRNTKNRKMSTYHAPSKFQPRKIHSKGLHVGAPRWGKRSSKSGKDCKTLNEICKEAKGGSCVKTCDRKSECDKKKDVCAGVAKPRKTKQKRKKATKEECQASCIPLGKCLRPEVPKPPKMEYSPVKCPPPKFATPEPCPDRLEDASDTVPCVEIRTKSKKEICVPPPLPEPPTDPVVLCPCPPPPKMHPGPCPCYDMKVEKPSKPSLPPCKPKEPYICPREASYCPPESLVCKMPKGCDPSKKKKRKK